VQSSFADAMQLVLRLEIGLLVLTFLATFLLPMKPLPEGEGAH
jgi:hypothetical protein